MSAESLGSFANIIQFKSTKTNETTGDCNKDCNACACSTKKTILDQAMQQLVAESSNYSNCRYYWFR